MSKTIRQIADELGVSKQAVHQKRKTKALSTALQPFTSTVDGVVYISVDGESLLKSAFSDNERKAVDVNEPSTVDGSFTPPVDGQNVLYEILNNELMAKNELIATLQKELETERQHSRDQADKIAVLAESAQLLHAGTMQKQLTSGNAPDGESPGLLRRIFGKKNH